SSFRSTSISSSVYAHAGLSGKRYSQAVNGGCSCLPNPSTIGRNKAGSSGSRATTLPSRSRRSRNACARGSPTGERNVRGSCLSCAGVGWHVHILNGPSDTRMVCDGRLSDFTPPHTGQWLTTLYLLDHKGSAHAMTEVLRSL